MASLFRRASDSSGIPHRMFQPQDGEYLGGVHFAAGIVAPAVRYEGAADSIDVQMTHGDSSVDLADRRTFSYTLVKGYTYPVMFTAIQDQGVATSTESDAADRLADNSLGLNTGSSAFESGRVNGLTIFAYRE